MITWGLSVFLFIIISGCLVLQVFNVHVLSLFLHYLLVSSSFTYRSAVMLIFLYNTVVRNLLP